MIPCYNVLVPTIISFVLLNYQHRVSLFVWFISRREVETFWVSDTEGTKIKVPFLVCAGIFNRVEISMKKIELHLSWRRKTFKVHPSWESSVGGFRGTSVPCSNTWICLQWTEPLSNAGFMPLPWKLSTQILTLLTYLAAVVFLVGFQYIWDKLEVQCYEHEIFFWIMGNHDCKGLIPLAHWMLEGGSVKPLVEGYGTRHKQRLFPSEILLRYIFPFTPM